MSFCFDPWMNGVHLIDRFPILEISMCLKGLKLKDIGGGKR